MLHYLQIFTASFLQAIHELRANKLRTLLSLLGITIGIFCIIAVFTMLDSLENNIRTRVSSLGSEMLYIGRWPWTPEKGVYKWWEFYNRPSMSPEDLRAVKQNVANVGEATLCLKTSPASLRYRSNELEQIRGNAVLANFDKLQNFEIAKGRYFSAAEVNGNTADIVLGAKVAEELFPPGNKELEELVTYMGKRFRVIGILRKAGSNIAGFDFDNSVIFPYYAAASVLDLRSLNYDPVLIVKSDGNIALEDMKLEVEGVLRRERRVKPGKGNDFAINQLSQVSEQLGSMFSIINLVGWVIGGFSIVVGAFGVANIMFVTVKERTKVIGLKKAIGATRKDILTEFLIEAVSLCVIGGLIGILVVVLLSLALTHLADFPVTLSAKNFLMGVSISALTGILAGLIPAINASRLDPVVAIRST